MLSHSLFSAELLTARVEDLKLDKVFVLESFAKAWRALILHR
jgi:hypothetical protein